MFSFQVQSLYVLRLYLQLILTSDFKITYVEMYSVQGVVGAANSRVNDNASWQESHELTQLNTSLERQNMYL